MSSESASDTPSFREATRHDAAEIAALHTASWRATYRGMFRDEFLDGDALQNRTDAWQAQLDTPAANQFVVVAEDACGIAGFACALGNDNPQWGTLLANLHVRPGRHRQGIGGQLIGRVATWCGENHPVCGLYLWVLEQNRQARLFYERLGATDRGGQDVEALGGGVVHRRRYAWNTLADIARGPRMSLR